MYTTLCFVFITIGVLPFSNGGNIKKFADLPIRYPGLVQDVTASKYGSGNVDVVVSKDDIPDECKQHNFCTVKPKDYPQDKFNSLFNGLNVVPQPNVAVDDYDNRQGDPDEKDDCDTTVTFEPLYRVKSLKGDWRTVIQAPENNYVQKVRLETCRKPGGKCFKVFPSIPRFVTSCKQKYNIWEVLVEGADGPETIKAELPVCCSCIYKTAKVGSRSAVPED